MSVSISQPCLALIILAAILVQTIAVAISFMYFNSVLATAQDGFSRSSVSCLMNANLRSAHREEEKSDPCWQVTRQLRYRIEKTLVERFSPPLSPPLPPYKVPGGFPPQGAHRPPPLPGVAAHVTGSVSPRQQTAEGFSSSSRGFLGQRIGAWEGESGLSFVLNVELRGGELLVPRAGLYYIYAQTYFRLPPGGETEGEAGGEEGTQLVQYIYRKMSSYSAPILLMKSSRSACWFQRQEHGLFSLHQAGSAHLQPADRLFVTVSNASAVETDGRASYFGAFLVG